MNLRLLTFIFLFIILISCDYSIIYNNNQYKGVIDENDKLTDNYRKDKIVAELLGKCQIEFTSEDSVLIIFEQFNSSGLRKHIEICNTSFTYETNNEAGDYYYLSVNENSTDWKNNGKKANYTMKIYIK